MKNFVLALILMLVFFPETSLNTALAIDKNSIHSIYLYRILGNIVLSDCIVLFLFSFVFFRSINRKSINFGIMAPILYVFIAYYFLGFLYNFFVAYELKAYLYDIKAGLYLFVPYMALKEVFNQSSITESLVIKVVIIYMLGIFLDSILVWINGGGHYVSQIGLPPILEIFPMALLVGMSFLFVQRKVKYWSRLALIFEIFSSVNRLNLGAFLAGILSLVWVLITKVRLSFRLMVGSIILLFYSIYVFAMNVIIFIPNPLTEFKSHGWEIRKIEIYNFFENAAMNFPILIGKGLGTTWREVIVPTSANVYSHGSFYDSVNNFIWHNTLGGLFYKFGIVGSLLLITYLSIISTRVLFHTRHTESESVGAFLSFSIPAFVMMNINGIGVLKGALISSIILFSVNHLMQEETL